MIDTDKYEGHDLARGRVGSDYNIYDRKGNIIFDADDVGSNMATLNLIADASLILEELIHYKKLYEYRVERFREDRAEIERLREETKWFRERLCRHIGYDYCKSEYEKHFGREMIE